VAVIERGGNLRYPRLSVRLDGIALPDLAADRLRKVVRALAPKGGRASVDASGVVARFSNLDEANAVVRQVLDMVLELAVRL
jgi:hypothetical protein